MTQEEARNKIKKLIEKYERLTSEDVKKYSESNTRKDFILPLFQALGWDIHNERAAEVMEEEDASGRKVDYAFKIDGITKFYLEAKKFSIDLNQEKWARQAIWYAYHKSLPWVVLTDFESIKVYNAEWEEQDAERSLAFQIPYQDYLKDKRLWLLSKDSIQKAELDKYAEDNFKKPKRIPVDRELAADLVRWRDLLYKELRAHNPSSIEDSKISEAVQVILDRLIFIKTAEDRGITEKSLLGKARTWRDLKKVKVGLLIAELNKLFREYNKAFNSKLFVPHFCEELQLKIDDNVYVAIISELDKNKKGIRYNLADIGADVFGSIYEQYLGHIQQKNGEKEDGKSKRKSQGIYYTPRYIVDYIVRNTLGEALKEKSPKEIKNIKILDPACGSGSFLIKAIEEVINYWQVQANKDIKYKKGTHLGNIEMSFKMRNGQKKLSPAFKMELLRNNIYGVDLDEEAVEIAQLNLLLRIMEQRRKLPNLFHNIACGNSLISGTEKELKKYFGKNWKKKKAFNWKEEFSEVFEKGGFDVIVGNPPYVNLANIEDPAEREYLKRNFETAKNKSDLYSFFIERAIKFLKPNGILGFIVSNSWIGTDSFSKFREYLVKNTTILRMVKLSLGVFEGATVTPVLIFLKKSKPLKNHAIRLFEFRNNRFEELAYDLSHKRIISSPGCSFSFSPDLQIKISTIKLRYIAKFSLGIKTSNDRKFILDKKIDDDCYKLLRGKDVDRYFCKYASKWIWYRPNLMMKKIGAGPRKLEYFLREKVLFRSITGGTIIATFDSEKYLTNDKVHILFDAKDYSLKFILAIVNSNVINYWVKATFGNLLEIKINQLEQIPIPRIDFSDLEEKAKHDKLVKLANRMLKLNKGFQKLHPEMDRKEYNEIKSEIEKTDKQIDQMVYKLYGLTPEEIKIIEVN